MNYLELTNRAIQEAGVDMDDLTSSTFANPIPVKMYTRFKRWVAQAWSDLQLENNEWEFGRAMGTATISPRILVSDGNRSVAPPVDSEYTSESGGVSFVVDEVETISGAWASGTAQALLTISAIEGFSGWILREAMNEIAPDTVAGVFNFEYYGRYDPRDFADDLQELDFGTVKVQDPETGNTVPCQYVPWADWKDSYELVNDSLGHPSLFTETPDGQLDFYPRPDKEYTISFEYTKEPTALSAYDDTPELDSRYHDVIYWRAVMYYANFDKDQGLWVAAKRRENQYMATIDRDMGPRVSFEPSRYNICD